MMKSNSKGLIFPNNDTIIWRYLDLTKYLYLITENKLFFPRLDKLSDQFEGHVSHHTYDTLNRRYSHFSSVISFLGGQYYKFIQEKADSLAWEKSFTLINSWCMDENESYALWKVYLGNNQYGVAIKSTVGCFLESVKDDKYSVTPTIVSYNPNIYTDSIEKIATTKNKHYDYEKELRFIIFDQYKNRKNKLPKFENGAYVKTNLVKLINEVRVSPMSPDWVFNLVKKITKKIKQSRGNKSIPVYVSTIQDKSF
jgi:hypothetical protein